MRIATTMYMSEEERIALLQWLQEQRIKVWSSRTLEQSKKDVLIPAICKVTAVLK